MKIILIKYGELTTKKDNRKVFINILYNNIKKALINYKVNIIKTRDRMYIETEENIDEVVDILKNIFGIHSIVVATRVNTNTEEIEANVLEVAKNIEFNTFKVETTRSDKSFPIPSMDFSRRIGSLILRNIPNKKVDVHNPDIIVTVEVREKYAFVRGNNIKGAGGMPTGTNGRAAVLISGGIDSPVAAYMMAKRGIELCAVHFASPPYTSELAEMKVMDLLKKVARYSGVITTYVVPFTELQEAIRDYCPEEYFTIIMRRLMMKLSQKVAEMQNCTALITGESVGQVASQTMYALACTDCAASMPVFRPCIGMDKEEIIAISRKIDTFDISIQPYEDCCTVFTPKHPKTRPHLDDVIKAEQKIPDLDSMLQKALDDVKKVIIK